MKDIVKSKSWSITPEAIELGVKFNVAQIFDVSIKKRSNEVRSFLKHRKEKITDIKLDDHLLQGYRNIFNSLKIKNMVSSPEYLINLVHKNRKLPQINTLVDVYNQISAEQRIVASAHDLDRIDGKVTLSVAHKKTEFKPLGNKNVELINPGEWYVHDDQHALCRLNCKQSRLSSCTLKTKNLLVYVQGNKEIKHETMLETLRKICQTIIMYNGGHYIILI